MPVFNTTGCVGHLLRTAGGFRACDANDKEIGVFETAALGSSNMLILRNAGDAARPFDELIFVAGALTVVLS
jgi:hypothetical protein